MINFRSKKPIIKKTRTFISAMLKKGNVAVELICTVYNLVVIPLQKLQASIYLQRKDIFMWLKQFQKRSDVCVIYSSKDRENYTKKSLRRLLSRSNNNFDIIWLDGSETPSAINLMSSFVKKERCIVGAFGEIYGGPDVAILLGLMIAYKKGYKHILLLENDVVLNSNWFKGVQTIFNMNPVNRYKVGACGITNYKNRNIRLFKRFSIAYCVGASAVVFARDVVPYILKQYGLTTSLRINREFSKNLGHISRFNFSLYHGQKNYLQGADWNFGPILLKNGFICLSPIPTLAQNMDDPPINFKTVYI